MDGYNVQFHMLKKNYHIEIYHLNLSCDTSVTSGLDSSRQVCGLQKIVYKFQPYIIITVYFELKKNMFKYIKGGGVLSD